MSIGVRFHGSVMSTLSNTPTLILYPDIRVKEFVDYHLLPNMDFDKITSHFIKNVIEIIEDKNELFIELFKKYIHI
jgi:hypothetical protein